MKPIFRNYLTILLVLMLVLTGQSMAVARGATGPDGQLVLCTGTGPVAVYVDENGVPIGPPMFCPDCALGHLVATALPDALLLLAIARPIVALRRTAHVLGMQTRTCALARAPPCFV
jgi:hypothetical protein